MDMRLSEVIIENIGLLRGRLAFKCGEFTVIEGTNEVGKSSIANGIQKALLGGHDPDLINRGSEKGEVILTFVKADTGEYAATFACTIKQKDTDRFIRTADGQKIDAWKAWADKAISSFTFDPLSLMYVKPKERVTELAKLLGIEITGAEIKAATGVETPEAAYDLEGFNALRGGLFSDRAEVNKSIKNDEGFLATATNMAPQGDIEEIKVGIGILESGIEELQHDMDEGISKLRVRAEEKIAAIRADLQKAIDGGSAETITEINEKKLALGKLREQKAQHDRAAGASAELSAIRKRIQDAQRLAERYTSSIAALDKLKTEKLANLPVKGVDIDPEIGDITVQNPEGSPIPWPKVNTATQIAVLCQVAKHGMRDVPLMVLDSTERIAGSEFDGFVEYASKMGIQVVAARVTKGPLNVTDGTSGEGLLFNPGERTPPTPYAADQARKTRTRK